MRSEGGALDFRFYDDKSNATITSSYRILRDDPSLESEPLAIAYFPSYYFNNQYVDIFNKHLQFIVLVNVFAVLLSILSAGEFLKILPKPLHLFRLK